MSESCKYLIDITKMRCQKSKIYIDIHYSVCYNLRKITILTIFWLSNEFNLKREY